MALYLVDEHEAVPVRSHDDLVSYFDQAGKPAANWRLGTEHELIGVLRDTGEAPTYDGPSGIGALLRAFAANRGDPVVENGHVIALARGDEQLTVEPGGQFELAGRPVTEDAQFVADLQTYAAELAEASRDLGLAWLGIGLRPFGTRGDIPWMPKQRYSVMRNYMPRVGSRGLDMMLRTATVQVNFDFSDEADALAKMKCLFSVTSILTALWAASPIVDERISGFQSYRAWIWRDTDRARCGLLPFVFDRTDFWNAYTEWALDVPMYFVYRNGYLPVPPDLTFRRFAGQGWNGKRATRDDWGLHLSTLFPEVRLKKYMEVRSCDGGSYEMVAALAPMIRGLVYDETAREAATSLTAKLSAADREQLADEVPQRGFAAGAGNHTVGELAKELVAIALDGLRRTAPASIPLLAPVEEIAASGRTQSDRIVELWQQHAGDRRALIAALDPTSARRAS